MKAIVYHGARDVRVETVPDPSLKAPTDALVRVVNAAICGSDLWPYRGISNPAAGSRIGHEFTGVVEAVGADVRDVKVGQFVAAPFSYAEGHCEFCSQGLYTSCKQAGFWGGLDDDGGQGEFVRVPFADATLVAIPDAVRDDAGKRTAALALTDVMGTGFHGVVASGFKAGDDVVVVGDGAVGLCAVQSARYHGRAAHHRGRPPRGPAGAGAPLRRDRDGRLARSRSRAETVRRHRRRDQARRRGGRQPELARLRPDRRARRRHGQLRRRPGRHGNRPVPPPLQRQRLAARRPRSRPRLPPRTDGRASRRQDRPLPGLHRKAPARSPRPEATPTWTSAARSRSAWKSAPPSAPSGPCRRPWRRPRGVRRCGRTS